MLASPDAERSRENPMKPDDKAREQIYGSSSKTNEHSTGVPILRMGNIQDGDLDCSKLKFLPTDHVEFPCIYLKIAMLESLLPRLLGTDVVCRLIPFEGKQDLEKQLAHKIRAYQNPNARFIVLRDLDSHPDCAQLKARLLRSAAA